MADAVERQRPAGESTPEEEVTVEPEASEPLEATAADWKAQLETVELDPDEDVVEE